MSACGYEFICLSWIISLKVQKMSWTLDGKIRIHARLSDTSHMYIDQFPSLHFKDWDEVFVSKELLIYKVVNGIISDWLSVRVRF